MSGGLSGDGNDVNQPRVLDMTTFFNAHKGTTIVLRFTNTDNNGTKGGTLEDREGLCTGNPANGLYIEYTTEPVPNQPPRSPAAHRLPADGPAHGSTLTLMRPLRVDSMAAS